MNYSKGGSIVALLLVFIIMFLVIASIMQAGGGIDIATDRDEDGEVKIINKANDAADLLNSRDDVYSEALNP